MQEEGLTEERQIPVKNKSDDYNHGKEYDLWKDNKKPKLDDYAYKASQNNIECITHI